MDKGDGTGTVKKSPQFQLRRLEDGRWKLVWRNPFATPGAETLLRAGLLEWVAAQKSLVLRDNITIESRPQSITLGYYTAGGFSPTPRWAGALRSKLVQDRIVLDCGKLKMNTGNN